MRICAWSSDVCSSDLAYREMPACTHGPANRSHTQDHDRQGARVMGTARNDLGRKAPESGAPDIRAGRRDAAGYAAGFAAAVPDPERQGTEERRGGKGGDRTVRSWGVRVKEKKK